VCGLTGTTLMHNFSFLCRIICGTSAQNSFFRFFFFFTRYNLVPSHTYAPSAHLSTAFFHFNIIQVSTFRTRLDLSLQVLQPKFCTQLGAARISPVVTTCSTYLEFLHLVNPRPKGVELPMYNFLPSPVNVLSIFCHHTGIKTTYTESVYYFQVIFPEILRLFHEYINTISGSWQWINFSRGSRCPLETSSLSA